MGGLVKIKNENYTDYDEVEGLNNIRLHTLCEDINGDIWLGSFGGGLFRFSKSKDSLPIELFADQTVLTSNNIYSLKLINDSSLIVATDKGFDYIILNKDRDLVKNIKYYQSNGYIAGENNMNALLQMNEEEILFGTVNGFTKFNIQSLYSKTATKLFITDILFLQSDFQIFQINFHFIIMKII